MGEGRAFRGIFARKFVAMAIGNFMEWFDFSVFGALVDIISQHYFPDEGSSIRFLKTVAIFGAGFVMRPMGGMFIGWIGDTVGRRTALEISILLMLFPSFLIGCLPTFAQIGWWAPSLLVLLRLIQGLAAGGELVGALIFTLEATDGHGTGFWGGACKATGNFGSSIGIGTAALLRYCLSAEQMNSWGWRLPFLLGIVFGCVGLYARKSLDHAVRDKECGSCEASTDELQSLPYASLMMQLIREHYQDVLLVICVGAFWGVSYYTCFVWLAYYMHDPKLLGVEGGMPHAWTLCFVGNLGLVVALPLGGWIGDKWVAALGRGEQGRKVVLQLALSGFMVVAVPALLLIRTRVVLCAALAILLLVLPVGLFGGNLPVFMVCHFSRAMRFSGVGLSYNFAHALFSSSVAVVQTALVLSASAETQDDLQAHLLPAYYVLLFAAVAIAALQLDVHPPHSLAGRPGTNTSTNDDGTSRPSSSLARQVSFPLLKECA